MAPSAAHDPLRFLFVPKHRLRTFRQRNRSRAQKQNPSDLERIMHVFVTHKLDYCNELYAEVNQSSLACLLLVQNAAAADY